MAIINDKNKDDEATRFMQPEIDKGCFLCGGAVTVPFIYWAGRTSWIVLHPDCAANLTLALSRDLHEIKKTTGTRLGFTDAPYPLQGDGVKTVELYVQTPSGTTKHSDISIETVFQIAPE